MNSTTTANLNALCATSSEIIEAARMNSSNRVIVFESTFNDVLNVATDLAGPSANDVIVHSDLERTVSQLMGSLHGQVCPDFTSGSEDGTSGYCSEEYSPTTHQRRNRDAPNEYDMQWKEYYDQCIECTMGYTMREGKVIYDFQRYLYPQVYTWQSAFELMAQACQVFTSSYLNCHDLASLHSQPTFLR
jgi:hypothetical protein